LPVASRAFAVPFAKALNSAENAMDKAGAKLDRAGDRAAAQADRAGDNISSSTPFHHPEG
jgi:type IV secretory pathway TrbL component